MLPNTTQLARQYQDNVFVLNPNLNPYAVGGDFWIKSIVYGGLLSGVYADSYIKFLNIWIQNSVGFFVDKWLASLGLSQRAPAFSAIGQIRPTVAPGVTVTLPVDTQLSYPGTTFTFLVTKEVVIAPATTPLIDVESQALGSGTAVGAGAILQLVTPIVGAPTFTVQNMVDGGNSETDAQCITRGLNKYQFPLLGGSEGDYNTWARSVPNVTDSFVLPNVGNQNIVGIYILSGGNDFNTILNNPALPYNRTADTDTITAASNYIQTKRPATDSFEVASVDTFQIPSAVINVAVELIPNLILSTFLPDFNMTVQQLISREIRRAVIETPVGGNRVGMPPLPYLFASDIADTLGLGLSAKLNLVGLYATILLDWEVTLTGGAPNYPLPNTILIDGNFPYVYDVIYSNLVITLLAD